MAGAAINDPLLGSHPGDRHANHAALGPEGSLDQSPGLYAPDQIDDAVAAHDHLEVTAVAGAVIPAIS